MLRRMALTVATASLIALGGAAAPAFAGTTGIASPDTLGACTYNYDANTFGGWCDGKGPDTYQAWAACNDGTNAYGATRWDGDRNGSYASCLGHGGRKSQALTGYLYTFV